MKIQRITIKNYKSIKLIEINCSAKINAFIGENSVGKSNIFDAINWSLGPVYPSFNSTLPQDHFMGDLQNEIEITLHFDDGNSLQLAEKWTDTYGREKSGLNHSGNYITEVARQNYCSAYLGVNRSILDYQPSNRWSLMGRVLLEINDLFKAQDHVDEQTGEIRKKTEVFKERIEHLRDEILFTVEDQHGTPVLKQFIAILQKESAKQLNREENEFNIDLNLYDPWNFYRTLQMVVTEPDTGLSFQASNLGMGIQASISIAILKAYSQVKLRNSTPLFIDEPELFLHPHAQRNFYRILCDLAESGTQIFYTTHSPDFLSVSRFNEIFLIRKNKQQGTYVRCAQSSAFVVDLGLRKGQQITEDALLLNYKNAYEQTGDNQKANEAFFAKKIILVEGQSESLCIPYLFDLINYDYLAKGISIVRCGNKGELDRFYRLYSELGIPCYVIFDGDENHKGTDAEGPTIRKNKEILSMFGIIADFPDGVVSDNFLGFETEFGENLGITAPKKGLGLFIQVRSSITTAAQVPPWLTPVTTKIDSLMDNATSILQKTTVAF